MTHWLVAALICMSGVAKAQDSDGNGCVDAREVAESACLSPEAEADPSLTMGIGSRVNARSTVGPDVVLGAGVTIATYATVAGRGVEPSPPRLQTAPSSAGGRISAPMRSWAPTTLSAAGSPPVPTSAPQTT